MISILILISKSKCPKFDRYMYIYTMMIDSAKYLVSNLFFSFYFNIKIYINKDKIAKIRLRRC